MKTGIRINMEAAVVGWIFRQMKRRIFLVDNFREIEEGICMFLNSNVIGD